MRLLFVLLVAACGCAEIASAQLQFSSVQCKGETLGPDQSLGPNEYLCQNGNPANRFGLSFMGMPQMHINGELVWHADARGSELKFQERDAHFVLYGEGMPKWETNCYGLKKGKEVRFDYEEGQVEIFDEDDVLVWRLDSTKHKHHNENICYPENTSLSAEDAASEETSSTATTTTTPAAQNNAQEKDDPSENTSATATTTNPAPYQLDLLGKCIGKRLEAGESLRPGEFLCNPKDKRPGRFGLNFMGMPQLWHDGKLVWHAAARGTELVYQTDSNFVLRGEGMVKWATQCYGKGEGKEIKFARGGLVVLDRDLNFVWRLKSNGVSTECYPFLE